MNLVHLNEFKIQIQLNCDAFETMMGTKISHVVLVAHNGQAFDVPFLLQGLDRNNLGHLWQDNNFFGYTLDTLQVVRDLFSELKNDAKPTNNKLSTLYQFFTGIELEDNHHALEDVKALYVVFEKAIVWNCQFFMFDTTKKARDLCNCCQQTIPTTTMTLIANLCHLYQLRKMFHQMMSHL